MMRDFHTINSINKVLDYLEQDISNNLEKKSDVSDLIDVHSFLSKLKYHHTEKEKTDKSKKDDLLTYSYMIINSLEIVFGVWDAYTHIIENRVVICNDLVYLDINMDYDITECVIAVAYDIDPIIAIEVVSTLKDIFGTSLKISNEVFDVDLATKEYIWGKDNIINHKKMMNGVRVKPIVVFNENTIGNC